METKFNFKSQICTTREQSERLIALGLKKETADMIYNSYEYIIDEFGGKERIFRQPTIRDAKYYEGKYDIPAWSLHRLIEMADSKKMGEEYPEDDNELWFATDRCYCWNNHKDFYSYNLYDSLIDCIEWLIKEGYFNKEYLENGNENLC